MLKDREIRMSLVKKHEQSSETTEPQTPKWTPIDVTNVIVNTAERLGKSAVIGAAVIIAMKTASEIAINAAPKRH